MVLDCREISNSPTSEKNSVDFGQSVIRIRMRLDSGPLCRVRECSAPLHHHHLFLCSFAALIPLIPTLKKGKLSLKSPIEDQER